MTSTTAHYSALTDWNGKNGLPRFDAVKDEDFAGAFDAALAAHDAEIDAIAGNSEAPSFANTVIALEIAGDERAGPRRAADLDARARPARRRVRLPSPGLRPRGGQPEGERGVTRQMGQIQPAAGTPVRG